MCKKKTSALSKEDFTKQDCKKEKNKSIRNI